MIKVRRIEGKDLKEICKLLLEFDEGTPNIELMQRIFERYNNNSDYVYLCADDNGKIVANTTGVICYSLLTQYSPFMVLENVIVSKNYRGKGIGKLMINIIEKIAKEKGCKEIMFVSSAHRKEAHKFYESLSYKLDVVQGFRKVL